MRSFVVRSRIIELALSCISQAHSFRNSYLYKLLTSCQAQRMVTLRQSEEIKNHTAFTVMYAIDILPLDASGGEAAIHPGQ